MKVTSLKKPKSTIAFILKTGFVVGVLDGLAAVLLTYIRTGRTPDVVFKFIASGLYGSEAFAGGMDMIMIGILLHFFIAYCWVIIFTFLFQQIKLMEKYPVTAGVVYGLFVWCCMNLIVLPLSKVPQVPFQLQSFVIGSVTLMVAIGIPAALMAKKHFHL